MRVRTRAEGPQINCIRVKVGSLVENFYLNGKSELLDRSAAIRRGRQFREVITSFINLKAKQASVDLSLQEPHDTNGEWAFEDIDLSPSFMEEWPEVTIDNPIQGKS
jgi:hypothetical protein